MCGREPPTLDPTPANFETIRASLLSGHVSAPDVTVGPLPVVSPDQLGTPSLLEPIQAYRWFIEYGGRHGTGWLNRVTRVLPGTPVPYNPVLCAPFVGPPTLMIVAPEDEMVHADYGVARSAYKLMPEPKERYDIAGGHFGLLYPQPTIRRSQRHPGCIPQTVAIAVTVVGHSPRSGVHAVEIGPGGIQSDVMSAQTQN